MTAPPVEESILPELAAIAVAGMTARQFVRAQVAPLREVKKLIRTVLHLIGIPVTPTQIDDATLMLYRPVLRGRDQNYRAGVRYLNSWTPELVAPLPRVYPAEALTNVFERARDEIHIAGQALSENNRKDVRVIEAVRPAIEGPILQQVQSPAREIVADIGTDGERPRYGYARVLVGPKSCSFCAMLAARGAVYTSEAAARGKLAVYHVPHPDTRPGGKGGTVGGNCDCSVTLVYRGKPWEGQQAQKRLEKLWENSTEGYGGKNARNAFRRAWTEKVRAGETDIYLPPSLAKSA